MKLRGRKQTNTAAKVFWKVLGGKVPQGALEVHNARLAICSLAGGHNPCFVKLVVVQLNAHCIEQSTNLLFASLFLKSARIKACPRRSRRCDEGASGGGIAVIRCVSDTLVSGCSPIHTNRAHAKRLVTVQVKRLSLKVLIIGHWLCKVNHVHKLLSPEGYCPEWYDEARMQAAYCNTMECPQDLVCTAQIDMLLLLDGSGSVNWYGPGFENERQFALDMFNLMSFGDEGAKAGVILFSWEAELVHPMSTDQSSLLEAVEGMSWPHWNTDTAAALTMAKTELTNSGRPEVSKEKTIVFLLTDGNPNSMWSTLSAAESIKEVATLYVVTIGNNLNMNAVKEWPSYPWEEHLIKVDEFELLESYMESMLSDVCNDLGCRESMTGNGQDYLGCQYQTVSGYTCQNWLEQTPQSHSYIPEWYPDGHLGDHNFCRNPDGDSTIWCITTNPSVRWEFCDPRDTSEVPEHLVEEVI